MFCDCLLTQNNTKAYPSNPYANRFDTGFFCDALEDFNSVVGVGGVVLAVFAVIMKGCESEGQDCPLSCLALFNPQTTHRPLPHVRVHVLRWLRVQTTRRDSRTWVAEGSNYSKRLTRPQQRTRVAILAPRVPGHDLTPTGWPQLARSPV